MFYFSTFAGLANIFLRGHIGFGKIFFGEVFGEEKAKKGKQLEDLKKNLDIHKLCKCRFFNCFL